jgi:hypothetical protein
LVLHASCEDNLAIDRRERGQRRAQVMAPGQELDRAERLGQHQRLTIELERERLRALIVAFHDDENGG